MYGRPTGGHDLLAGGEVRQEAGDHGRQRRRLQSRLQLRRHDRDRGHPDRSRAGAARRRRVPQRQRRQRAGDGPGRGQRQAAACSSSSPSYPITPASELLHQLARHDRFGVRTVQAEDEIAAANMALGAAFGGQLGVTATSGPGMDLKAETIGARGDARAAAGDHRRPARRPLDRDADQNRTVRPADGDPRPPRRVAAAGDRRLDPGRLLRLGGRGGAHRGPLPDPGDPARRHLPDQLLRALASAGRRRPAGDRPRIRHGAQRRRRVPPLPARRARRPALGDPRHARPAAPDRRPREGARQRQDQLRRGEPRADDRAARREAGEARRGAAAARGRRRRGRRAAGDRLGLDLRRDPGRRPPRPRPRASRSRPRTCASSTRCRATPARSSAPSRRC